MLKLPISSFSALNLTQFMTALNDNLYKLLLVFFLINLAGEEHSNTILALAGAIFVIPFLLFASFSGSLADRYSKRKIIFITRWSEIIITCGGVLSFLFRSTVGGYTVLFFMAFQSAIFSPCKYGIIPEIVKKKQISRCNGIITATTYLAIIFGTFLGSFLTEMTHKNFVLAGFTCVLVAFLGALFSTAIEKTKPQARKKRISVRFIADIIRNLKRAKKRRYLFSTIVFSAYFLFIGAYTQLNIIPFTLQSLHLSEVDGGYLFLVTAIGIGIGSFLAGRLSGKGVELGFAPFASLGVAICLIGLYFFASYLFAAASLLILLGFFGGFYVVPFESFIQVASPPRDRGQNVATGNFLSFSGVIVASGLLALFGNGLHLQAAQGFFIVGILTFVMTLFLLLLYADQVLRLVVTMGAKLFFRIYVVEKQRSTPAKPSLLVAPRTSWLDTLIVMVTLPRLIRYIVPIREGKKKRPLLYRLLWLIPVDIEHFSPMGAPTLEAIGEELRLGHSVCLMHPIDLPTKTLKAWEVQLAHLLKDIEAPIIPIHIFRDPTPKKSTRLGQLLSLTKGSIKVTYGVTST